MAKVILRFYEELNFHLPEHLRKRDFGFESEEEATIQAIIESLGVPSGQVDLILANGQSVGFGHVAKTGERFSIYPVFESVDITELTCLPHRPLRSTKFVLDSGLEDLAAHMKRVGHDVRFESSSSWSEIMKISEEERRIILTSNPERLKSGEVTHAILLPPAAMDAQVQRIMDRLGIHPREHDCPPELR
jgi:uncharacterized protein